VTIDLEQQRITHPKGWAARFEIEPDRKAMIMLGLDAVGVTLQDQETVTQFEKGHLQENPWLAD
jgi:3-isopropylmalate/(R)-2-methylmalate dehydratase small subunit